MNHCQCGQKVSGKAAWWLCPSRGLHLSFASALVHHRSWKSSQWLCGANKSVHNAHNAVKSFVGLGLFFLWFTDGRTEKETSASRYFCFPDSPSVKCVGSICHSSWVSVEPDLLMFAHLDFFFVCFPWLNVACWNKHWWIWISKHAQMIDCFICSRNSFVGMF